MLRKAIAAAATLLAFAGSVQAQGADAITFDVNGGGAGGVINGATTFDWQPGNAVAYGGNPSGGLAVGDIVTLRYQANLATITDGTNVLFTNGGSGSFFTAVATFQEVVLSVGANGSATFGLAPGGGTFQIFRNTVGAGNNATGEGFLAGASILTGSVSNIASSDFTVTNTTPVLLDQFGGDGLGGQQTVTGSGASDITVTVLIGGVNTAFFTDLFTGNVITLSFFNTSQVTPFRQVDPTNCLFDGDAAGTNDGCDNGGFTRNLGAVNAGVQNTGTDFDFQIQADANQSFQRQGVPEPGSIALAGLGLFALGLSARRRARRS